MVLTFVKLFCELPTLKFRARRPSEGRQCQRQCSRWQSAHHSLIVRRLSPRRFEGWRMGVATRFGSHGPSEAIDPPGRETRADNRSDTVLTETRHDGRPDPLQTPSENVGLKTLTNGRTVQLCWAARLLPRCWNEAFGKNENGVIL